MNKQKGFETGDIMWTDLTVKNAEEVLHFYQEVVGWQAPPETMDGYDDYHMSITSGKKVCGICHAKSINKDLPSQWLIYIMVEDMERA